MHPVLVFYVSGHGYGHAVRAASVIRALWASGFDGTIHVRSAAAPPIFGLPPTPDVQFHSGAAFDTPIAERTPMDIDGAASLAAAAAMLDGVPRIAAAEARFLREVRAGLVLADIPFLAGAIAAEAGLPALAIGSFTWDWIYQAWDEDSPVIHAARASYASMDAWLRAPLCHDSAVFRRVVDVPLIVREPAASPDAVHAYLGLDDGRPVVLFGMRGGLPPGALARIARQSPDILFLWLGDAGEDPPPNVRVLSPASGFSFTDILQVCDAVVSKLGYGTIAECVRTGARLLWPARRNFREDGILEAQTRRYVVSRQIPTADFASGDWAPHLRALLDQPATCEPLAANGAAVCAGHILAALR